MNEFGRVLEITGEVKYIGEGENPEDNIYFQSYCRALKEVYGQPESSKREDHILIYKDENGNKTPIRDLFNPNYGCGTPNTMET